ncbi:MAG: GNAT family N-acetyltransferase [Caldilinea sp. CFX5]|nr:GNAT family N-acetyltransferase [Caldilinea sp. CFX5]
MNMNASFLSPLGDIQIAKAGADSLATAMLILGEAATRLQARGIQQWTSPPPPGLSRLLEQEIAAGHLYLAWLATSQRPIGVFRLRWADDYWTTAAGKAGYVHSLALCDDACGYGIGEQILGWIGDYLRDRQCHYLRLDCIASNARLRRYYEEQGFLYRGQVVDGDYTLALYELSLQSGG